MKRAEQLGAGHPEFKLLFQQAIRLEPALGNGADIAPMREKSAF